MSNFDVIVVGGGGAGMAAAIEAAGCGRTVALIEKNESLGGSTAWSVGSISATNTRLQREVGIVDHPDAHFEDLDLLAGSLATRDNLELRRLLVNRSTDMLAWLENLGVVFAGPNIEPPHRVRRMHNVLPNSRAFVQALGTECRRLGVSIMLNTLVDDLIVENGAVTGVKVRTAGASREIHCNAAVVLAGGDYSASEELKERFAGPETARLAAVNPTATGDAISVALRHGAEVVNGDLVRGPIMRFIPPTRDSLLRRLPPNRLVALALRWALAVLPAAIKRPVAMGFLTTALGVSHGLFREGAILVNAQGERFCDELDTPDRAVPLQPESHAFIILDAATASKFAAWPHFVSTAPGVAYAYLDDYRRNRGDIYAGADTLEQLAVKLNMSAESLARAFGTRDVAGPFVALGPVKSYVIFTEGGLNVNAQLQVLGSTTQPIDHLYAAGSTGQGGLLLEGHGHHLGWAFVSGRIAGRNAALEIEAQPETGES